ncbi:MAG: single-stranded DNA-binding protein [Shewanella sp.]
MTLIGRLGSDPEIRQLDGGASVARFSLATSDSYKDKDGNWQETTEWHNIVIWRELAERAAQNLKKGGLCYVEGKISHRKYTGTDGVEKNITDIVVNFYRSVEKKEGDGQRSTQGQQPVASLHQTNHAASAASQTQPHSGDDLPF